MNDILRHFFPTWRNKKGYAVFCSKTQQTHQLVRHVQVWRHCARFSLTAWWVVVSGPQFTFIYHLVVYLWASLNDKVSRHSGRTKKQRRSWDLSNFREEQRVPQVHRVLSVRRATLPAAGVAVVSFSRTVWKLFSLRWLTAEIYVAWLPSPTATRAQPRQAVLRWRLAWPLFVGQTESGPPCTAVTVHYISRIFSENLLLIPSIINVKILRLIAETNCHIFIPMQQGNAEGCGKINFYVARQRCFSLTFVQIPLNFLSISRHSYWK